MDFLDEVNSRSGRFASRLEHPIETEEATKTSFVLPFIQMLGYDIFDPSQVIPEYTADVGTKKSEKVDYALMQDGKPVILIECKRHGSNLDDEEMSQLFRYFTATDTHFGILTDGIAYRFFSDLDQPNMMDPKPFFEFNMLDFTEPQVKELKRFTESAFQLHETIDAARQLKYLNEIKRIIATEIAEPSDDFVRFFMRPVYGGRFTAAAREMFGTLVRDAFAEFINERFDTRLNAALQRIEDQQQTAQAELPEVSDEADKEEAAPDPTPLELEAFNIVKASLREQMDIRRLRLAPGVRFAVVYMHKDATHTGYGELLCRFLFKTPNLRVNLCDRPFGENDALGDLDDLFGLADRFSAAAKALEAGADASESGASG